MIVENRYEPWARLPELRQLGVNYRSSSIVVNVEKPEIVSPYGALGKKLHAGDRAPEAPGLIDVETGKAISVFGILSSSRHTAFIFSDSINKANSILEPLRASHPSVFQEAFILRSFIKFPTSSHCRLVLHDSGGYAYKGYQVGTQEKVVVVRPDGVIGAISHGAEGLKKYVELILSK